MQHEPIKNDLSRAELSLALGAQIVRDIIGADSILSRHEIDFLEVHFPNAKLALKGFVEPSGKFTDRHRKAVEIARNTLRDVMSADEKMTFLQLFIEASLVDGYFDTREGHVILDCARDLGVELAELERLVASMPIAAGRVKFQGTPQDTHTPETTVELAGDAPRLLIADFDGTLACDIQHSLRLLNEKLYEMDLARCALSAQEFVDAVVIGNGPADLARLWMFRRGLALTHPHRIPQIRDELFRFLTELQDKPHLEILDDGVHLVEQARQRGMRIAYVSNNSEQWLRNAIASTGGKVPMPDEIVASRGPDGRRRHAAKPAPDMLRLVMEQNNVQPWQTYVIGDRVEKDRLAALRAGIPVENVFIRPSPTLEGILGPDERLYAPGTMRRFPLALVPQSQTFGRKNYTIRVESLHGLNIKSPTAAFEVIQRCVKIQERLSKKKSTRPFKPVTPEDVVREYGDDRRCLIVEAQLAGQSVIQVVSRCGEPGTGKIVMGDVRALFGSMTRFPQAREVFSNMLRVLGLHKVYIEMEDGYFSIVATMHTFGFRLVRDQEHIDRVIRSFSKAEPNIRMTDRLTGRYERGSTKADDLPMAKYLMVCNIEQE